MQKINDSGLKMSDVQYLLFISIIYNINASIYSHSAGNMEIAIQSVNTSAISGRLENDKW